MTSFIKGTAVETELPESNLLLETLRAIEVFGYNLSDIKWCGTTYAKTSTKEFLHLINVRYKIGDIQCVNPELVVVFKDGTWLSRSAPVGGSECWILNKVPKEPEENTFLPLVYDYKC